MFLFPEVYPGWISLQASPSIFLKLQDFKIILRFYTKIEGS